MAIGPERPTEHVVRLRALGATVDVEVSGSRAETAAAELRRVWQMCTLPYAVGSDSAPHGRVRVVLHDEGPVTTDFEAGVVEGSDLPDLLQMVTQAVTRAAIDSQAGRVVMLHAAGIQEPSTGAVAAFVAPGGTGKTTLVRTLGQDRGYVTDETVAVTSDNAVLPYPKPLSVRRGPSNPRKDETDPSTLGLQAPVADGTLAAIVMLNRKDGYAGPPAVELVPTLDAIAALTPETSHLPEMDKPLQRMADLCESVGGVRRVTYGEAEQLAPLVDEWLGTGR